MSIEYKRRWKNKEVISVEKEENTKTHYPDKKLYVDKKKRDKEQKKFSDLISFVDFKEKMPW
jgi:hypothetical protein